MKSVLFHGEDSYEVRISRVSDAANFSPPWSSQTTHTASIPRTNSIKMNDKVTVEGVEYRVLSVRHILDKTRLELSNK